MKHVITRTYYAVIILLVFFISNTAIAQDEVVAEAEEETGLSISGYVDAYYQYNFTNPEGPNIGRVFDIPSNQFSLGLVQTMFKYSTAKSEFVADLTFGPNADLGNFGNSYILGSDAFISTVNIKQAYMAYKFSDNVKFTIGQYGTHIGYELIDAPLNYNYSLSYLFGNGPFYHTGAKLDFTISENFGLMLGVVNGWDALWDPNNKKSVTAQISLAPTEEWSVYLNWIGGDEYGGYSAFGDYEDSYTSLFDLTTSYTVSDAFKVGLNAAYGSFKTGAPAVDDEDQYTDDATWFGAALYLNYALSETFGLGLRAEHFNDEMGVRYPATADLAVNAFTLTGDIKLDGGKFNIKPEFRFDSADKFFVDKDGEAVDSQATLGAAFIYTF